MIKRLLLLSFLLCTINLFSLDDDQIEEIKKRTWRTNILLNTSLVTGDALQFAIFDTNPTNLFVAKFSEVKSKTNSAYGEKNDPQMKIVALAVSWDMLFAVKKGDEIYLLTKETMSGYSSNEVVETAYFVSKTAYIKNRPAVWIVQLNTEIGQEQNITLTEENVIYLDELVEESHE